MNREAVEAIVRAEFTHEPGADEIVRAIVDGAYREDDRDYIAADLWTMGAGVAHEGCVYGPPEPADADYENNCETCQAHLLKVADQILAAVAETSEPDDDEYDESADACPACDTLPSKCHGGCCEDCNHASSWHAGMATGSSAREPDVS